MLNFLLSFQAEYPWVMALLMTLICGGLFMLSAYYLTAKDSFLIGGLIAIVAIFVGYGFVYISSLEVDGTRKKSGEICFEEDSQMVCKKFTIKFN